MFVCEIVFDNLISTDIERVAREAGAPFKKITMDSVNDRESGNVPVDKEYMPGRYSIGISDAEVSCYRMHHAAWSAFLGSMEETCLVIEAPTSINASFSQIVESLQELESGWDVFFPFDRSNDNVTNYEPYVLGYEWGSHAYFISRQGAEKMLNRNVIRQPVDDEILAMSLNEELQIFSEDTSFFEGTTWTKITEQRHRTITETIFGNASWSGESRHGVRNILTDLHHVCSRAQCSLVMDSGSLLAVIRHGDLMPWDDDIDLALNSKELQSFLDALENHPTLKFGKYTWAENGCTFYKIWYEDGEKISGHVHTFPFADVWLFDEIDGRLCFHDGKIFPTQAFYPLTDSTFLDAPIKLPANSLRCLDIQYSDWRRRIQVFPYSHKLEQSHFLPLSVPIVVDERGRMIVC